MHIKSGYFFQNENIMFRLNYDIFRNSLASVIYGPVKKDFEMKVLLPIIMKFKLLSKDYVFYKFDTC